jgi:hypothetical protein
MGAYHKMMKTMIEWLAKVIRKACQWFDKTFFIPEENGEVLQRLMHCGRRPPGSKSSERQPFIDEL